MLIRSSRTEDNGSPPAGTNADTTEAQPQAEAPKRGAADALWRRVLPFVLALALVLFVVVRLDLAAFARHLQRASYGAYFGFTVAFIVALLAADTFATALIYRRIVAPVAYRDFFALRGASYLPSMLNHHLGQAFITLYLSRVHRVDLLRVAGATLVVYASWTGCLLLIGALALPLNGYSVAWAIVPLGAGVIYLALLAWRPAALAKRKLLAPLFETGVTGHIVALATRIPHLVILFVGTWIPFFFFDVHIPLSAAAAYVPILMVVTTLPLTPQGLGTRDVLAAVFFERFAEGATHPERLANIAAATASFGVAITLVEAVVGLALMRWALPKALRRP